MTRGRRRGRRARTEPRSGPSPSRRPRPSRSRPRGPSRSRPRRSQPVEETPAPTAESTGGASGGGSTEVTLPALGESVTEGTVSRWLKQVGDRVEADEPLLEVSTDKVDTEIPSPASGTLLEIRVQEDESVEVGAVLAVVGEADQASGGGADASGPTADEARRSPAPRVPPQTSRRRTRRPPRSATGPRSPSSPRPATRAARRPSPPRAPPRPRRPGSRTPSPSSTGRARPRPSVTPVASDGEASYVTPLVRKLAKEHSVDLASVTGTGVGGRIRKQDVLAAAEEARKAAEAPAPQPEPAAAAPAAAAAAPAESSALRGTTEKMSRLRKTIAKRMVESLQVSAQLTATVEVDLDGHLPDPGPGQGRLQEARGRQPVLPALHHQGGGRGAQGLPEGQRDDRHRGGRGHLPECRAHRHRRGHREGPAGPGDQGRRRPEHRRAGQEDRRPGRDGPGATRSPRTSSAAAPSPSPTTARPGR